jgi:hypothetical protein
MIDTTKKAMTLEKVRNRLMAMSCGAIGDEIHEHGEFRRMADAIDAHLAAQREGELAGFFRQYGSKSGDKYMQVDEALQHEQWVIPLYLAPPTPRVEVTRELTQRVMDELNRLYDWGPPDHGNIVDIDDLHDALIAVISEKGHG